MFDYFFVFKLSPSRKLVGYFSLALILISLLLPWFTGGNAFDFNSYSDKGYYLQRFIPGMILVGFIFCYFSSNLLLLSGLGILVMLWFPGVFALDNLTFYPGPIIVNLGSVVLLLNQFLPETYVRETVGKVLQALKKK
jgi:hypothetical protein